MTRFSSPLAFLLLLMPLHSAAADSRSFARWLAEFRSEAIRSGLSPQTVDVALQDIAPDPTILELDRKQPESTKTFEEYIATVVSEERQENARLLFEEHRELLGRISARYGVQPEYIVALWGVESNFGENTGDYNVIEALATLAYDGRRSEFFRSELFNALRILDEGHISSFEMSGSWAGAMGQCQFMPSSFINFGADGNGDGAIDIWTNTADVFASIANYLSQSGWNPTIGWGGYVAVDEGEKLPESMTYADWQARGLRAAALDGKVAHDSWLRLISANSDSFGPHFLVTENFDTLLKWNRSRYFATAVGLLADSIHQWEPEE